MKLVLSLAPPTLSRAAGAPVCSLGPPRPTGAHVAVQLHAPPSPIACKGVASRLTGGSPRKLRAHQRPRVPPAVAGGTGAPRGAGGENCAAEEEEEEAVVAATRAEYERLLGVVRELGDPGGVNVVAFSGGVDSSLVAHLVFSAFGPRSVACIGVSPSLSAGQLALARAVARGIGVQLREVPTHEGSVPGYLANEGEACFHCKTSLYSTLQQVGAAAVGRAGAAEGGRVVLFNGTNADDLLDPTRVGILAATNFAVGSPLAAIPKATVRELAHHVGLPNWNTAASPCLRSRLELGVEATPAALAAVDAAEAMVRRTLGLGSTDNMRVRILREGGGVVEVDRPRVEEARARLGELRAEIEPLGLAPLDVRAFRSGSVAGPAATAKGAGGAG